MECKISKVEWEVRKEEQEVSKEEWGFSEEEAVEGYRYSEQERKVGG